MGHWNTQFSGHFHITEEDGQGHSSQQHEPSSLYGNVTNVHHPSIRPSIPPPNSFSFPRLPEHRDNAFFHNMVQYHGFPPQASQADFDLSIPQLSNQFIPYTTAGDSSVQAHGANEQLSLPNAHYGGGLRANFPIITSLLDHDQRKRKSLEMPLFPLHNLSEGSSSSVNPSSSGQIELKDSQNAPFSLPYEHYARGALQLIEGEHSRSRISRPNEAVGQETAIPYTADPMVQGSRGPSSVPYHSNPWTDMQFGASSSDASTYLWPPAPSFPYMTASPSGARVEAGNTTGLLQQGYHHLRSSYSFMPPSPFAHVPPYLPMQGGSMGYGGITYPLQPSSSAQSIPTGNSWMGPNYQVDSSPAFVPPPTLPTPPAIQLFGHRRGETVPIANPRQSQVPTLRHDHDDEGAIADATSSQETGSSDDQHNDMRMDIDDMSYEELLALEEEIGQVATGLTEDFIERNLRSRTITLSEIGIDLEDIPSPDHQINLCTVCQDEYEGGDTIGSLDCGHEYHTACIKQWLLLRNTCPVCKATALSSYSS